MYAIRSYYDLDLVVDGDTVRQSNIENWEQVLNLKEASLTVRFRFSNKAEISYQIYALRGMPNVGLIDIAIKALKNRITSYNVCYTKLLRVQSSSMWQSGIGKFRQPTNAKASA